MAKWLRVRFPFQFLEFASLNQIFLKKRCQRGQFLRSTGLFFFLSGAPKTTASQDIVA